MGGESMSTRVVTIAVLFLWGNATTAFTSEIPPDQLSFFEKRIRPVLDRHCYQCHSRASDEVEGGLLLDTREGSRRGGATGPAVVPGDPEASLMIQAIRHESFEMPPDDPLPQTVIDDFVTWVKMGAPDPRDGTAAPVSTIDWNEALDFWSFQKLSRPSIPARVEDSWAQSDIDQFVLRKQNEHHLPPARTAKPSALLRRVYFDLTGLPPTPAEIERYSSDPTSDAYVRIVDQLLSSPRFGERWGRHWLDVARFAESSGGGRSLMFPHAWRFRDYVIGAWNQDKPFDRLILEQIAGDLLPFNDHAERAEHLTAAGFLMLGAINYELQDKELLRMEVVDEQIETVGRAFLGMTIGCARCHDHKFRSDSNGRLLCTRRDLPQHKIAVTRQCLGLRTPRAAFG